MTSRPAVQFKINFGLPTNLSHTPPPVEWHHVSVGAAKVEAVSLDFACGAVQGV